MPSFAVTTAAQRYEAVVERGALSQLGEAIPERVGKLFVVTTADVWQYHGKAFLAALEGRACEVLYYPGGEEHKRLAAVERLAEEMLAAGGDRASVVIGFGGGIVTDLAGFLAAIYMRGVRFLSIPTTLLAQVDAGVGGKTGANLQSGKNLIGAFHQPLAVLIDPDLLSTLPEREYRAGLYEILKCGIIGSAPLFRVMKGRRDDVLARNAEVSELLIAESVKIKCEVVSADEKESGVRRTLNYGHTIGHAIEAETHYSRYLHGEAVALGMVAAAWLATLSGHSTEPIAREIVDTIRAYGPVPAANDLDPQRLLARLAKDKKTLLGSVHFVLARLVGETTVVTGIDDATVLAAIEKALA
jgi:3-dehydroquinate synthase